MDRDINFRSSQAIESSLLFTSLALEASRNPKGRGLGRCYLQIRRNGKITHYTLQNPGVSN